MIDSRRDASRGCRTAAMAPSASRSTPTIGWSTRWMPSPRSRRAALTESTRNGQSSVLVSTTEPGASYPCSSRPGVNARTAIGSAPLAEANSKAPPISRHSASGGCSPTLPSADSRRRKASAKARTAGARSASVRSPIMSSRDAPAVISCLAQALLQRVQLSRHRVRQPVPELLEELADGRDLLLPLLDVDAEDLLETVGLDVEAVGIERRRGRHPADRRVPRLGGVVAAAEDPLEDARVLAEARPQEAAGLEVLAEPVDVE